jgi:hypothetical protein
VDCVTFLRCSGNCDYRVSRMRGAEVGDAPPCSTYDSRCGGWGMTPAEPAARRQMRPVNFLITEGHTVYQRARGGRTDGVPQRKECIGG